MADYCRTTDCLRAYILRYFGEPAEETCHACSNCKGDFVDKDITGTAQKILGCIAVSRERFGAGVIVDTLRGSQSARLSAAHMTNNDYYGVLCSMGSEQLHAVINHLCVRGCLRRDSEGLPVLRLTAYGRDVLNGEARVTMRAEREPEKPVRTAEPSGKTLFDRLRAIRFEAAKREFVPPYAIFSDKTLLQMCEERPQDEESLLRISGVGEVKLRKYGALFLKAIQEDTDA